MELTGMQKFKAMNDKLVNLKECEGLIIAPIAFHTYQYLDADQKEHTVLILYNGLDKEMYKTEVQAFIEKFLKYDEYFGGLPDEEKPQIKIIINVSKKGNRYVNFDLVETEV